MNTNYDKACKANENFTAKQKLKLTSLLSQVFQE